MPYTPEHQSFPFTPVEPVSQEAATNTVKLIVNPYILDIDTLSLHARFSTDISDFSPNLEDYMYEMKGEHKLDDYYQLGFITYFHALLHATQDRETLPQFKEILDHRVEEKKNNLEEIMVNAIIDFAIEEKELFETVSKSGYFMTNPQRQNFYYGLADCYKLFQTQNEVEYCRYLATDTIDPNPYAYDVSGRTKTS